MVSSVIAQLLFMILFTMPFSFNVSKFDNLAYPFKESIQGFNVQFN